MVFSNGGPPPARTLPDVPVETPVGGPVAVINAIDQGDVGQNIVFDGTDSEAQDEILSYIWDFGDGTAAMGATVNHIYASSGVYSVILTVTDAGGQVNVVSKQIIIN
jgi:bacillopeptidase F